MSVRNVWLFWSVIFTSIAIPLETRDICNPSSMTVDEVRPQLYWRRMGRLTICREFGTALANTRLIRAEAVQATSRKLQAPAAPHTARCHSPWDGVKRCPFRKATVGANLPAHGSLP